MKRFLIFSFFVLIFFSGVSVYGDYSGPNLEDKNILQSIYPMIDDLYLHNEDKFIVLMNKIESVLFNKKKNFPNQKVIKNQLLVEELFKYMRYLNDGFVHPKVGEQLLLLNVNQDDRDNKNPTSIDFLWVKDLAKEKVNGYFIEADVSYRYSKDGSFFHKFSFSPYNEYPTYVIPQDIIDEDCGSCVSEILVKLKDAHGRFIQAEKIFLGSNELIDLETKYQLFDNELLDKLLGEKRVVLFFHANRDPGSNILSNQISKSLDIFGGDIIFLETDFDKYGSIFGVEKQRTFLLIEKDGESESYFNPDGMKQLLFWLKN